jgi:hypothetical protein
MRISDGLKGWDKMKPRSLSNPLSEVFGFPVDDISTEAQRYRQKKLCPFNNKVPNCTKDKANNPLGVCSIFQDNKAIITWPTRFRQDWIIIENAAQFFFPRKAKWTSLTEIKILDEDDQTAGNVDFILISYDDKGKLIDFGSLEVQGVYITGNLRNPLESYMETPAKDFKWKTGYNYPKPDFLSSSRKRLVPQMLYKGGIFKAWGKKQAVVLQKAFFDTLPILPKISRNKADIAWFLYDLVRDDNHRSFRLVLNEIVYTGFEPALSRITTPKPGGPKEFTKFLQERLDERLEGLPQDVSTLEVALKDMLYE